MVARAIYGREDGLLLPGGKARSRRMSGELADVCYVYYFQAGPNTPVKGGGNGQSFRGLSGLSTRVNYSGVLPNK